MSGQLRSGKLEVITGCMFSGKSEDMHRRIRRAEIAKKRWIVFKPNLDTRDGLGRAATHAQKEALPCTVVPADDPERILDLWTRNPKLENMEGAWDADVVAIDEAQFFAPGIVQVCRSLVASGLRVIVVGLELDYKARPFGPMPALMAYADHLRKHAAICTVCGGRATRSQRLTLSANLVEIGAKGAYDARCHEHFTIPEE